MLKTCSVALLIVATFACTACSANANEGESEEAPSSVLLEMSTTPSVSIAAGEGDAATVTLAAALDNPDERARSFAYWGELVLYDEKGALLHKEPVQGRGSIAAGGHYTFKASSPVSHEQLEALSSIRLICGYDSEGSIGAFCQHTPQTVTAERAQYLEEEARRIEQERIDAWFARFPVGDYSDTVLIGDSIMQNATASLRAAMPGVTVNADANRSLEVGGLVFEDSSPNKGVLDHVRNDEGAYARYVIHTGNNDPEGVQIQHAEEIIACLGEDKEIYFVTEAMRNETTSVQVTNATIADVVSRYPNVHMIDWHGIVAGHEYDYLADIVHPRRDREPDYADCIKQGLDTPYPR